MAYQSPGCSFSIDEMGVQEILGLLNGGTGLDLGSGSDNSGSDDYDDDYNDYNDDYDGDYGYDEYDDDSGSDEDDLGAL